MRKKFSWDDALDVWACHGMGGFLGTLLLGIFADSSVNPAGPGKYKFGISTSLHIMFEILLCLCVDI